MRSVDGYTLIELLIVITIIILFSGLSLAYYHEFNTTQQLVSATAQVEDALNLARSKASAGEILNPNSCTGDNQFWGYQFHRTSSTTYQIEFCCGGADDDADRCPNAGNNANIVQKYTSTTSTLNLSDSNPILFRLKNAGTNLTQKNTLTVTDNSGNNSKDIIICPVGTITQDTQGIGIACN